MAYTYTLQVTVTDKQKSVVDRWFARWNPRNTTPYATVEDAFIDIVKNNVKNFIAEENFLRLPEMTDALRAAPDNVQDQVLALLEPYLP